jgi:raffinose/stachyose/melibiose transport system substrate-binding protein
MFARYALMRAAVVTSGVALAAAALSGCSASGGSGGEVTISFLTQSDPQSTKAGQDFVAAFEKQYPTIKVKLDTQPAGTEGDNLTKTKLSTGDMNDVFSYNSGSLLQALSPDNQLVDLSKESWVKNLTDDFKRVVSTDKGLYGAPVGTSFAGGVLYNKKVYDKLGLKVPTTWSEFISNSEKIKTGDPGVTPVLQTFGTDWTAQIFVLADYANVDKQNPDWSTKYTENKVHYSEQPAFAGFQHQEDVFKAGLLNRDFASLQLEPGLKQLANGQAAQYPMLTNAVATIAQDSPGQLNDVGFFALPADKAGDTQATIWQPDGLYIPRTTTGAKLDAAKKFIAFVTASDAGCAVQNKVGIPAGPYVTSSCKLTGEVPPMIQDVNKYFTDKATAPALEFLSPVKGPALPNITVQVGSGISTATQGAALYDQDVKKQAQQLGLKGW